MQVFSGTSYPSDIVSSWSHSDGSTTYYSMENLMQQFKLLS